MISYGLLTPGYLWYDITHEVLSQWVSWFNPPILIVVYDYDRLCDVCLPDAVSQC